MADRVPAKPLIVLDEWTHEGDASMSVRLGEREWLEADDVALLARRLLPELTMLLLDPAAGGPGHDLFGRTIEETLRVDYMCPAVASLWDVVFEVDLPDVPVAAYRLRPVGSMGLHFRTAAIKRMMTACRRILDTHELQTGNLA